MHVCRWFGQDACCHGRDVEGGGFWELCVMVLPWGAAWTCWHCWLPRVELQIYVLKPGFEAWACCWPGTFTSLP